MSSFCIVLRNKRFILITLLAVLILQLRGQTWIRINQLGYLPESVKVAVCISSTGEKLKDFSLCDAVTGIEVYSGKVRESQGRDWGMKSAGRLDFSGFTVPGGYYIKVNNTRSVSFRISAGAYKGVSDYILRYLRQQQCGYNPFMKDSCHTHDGIIVDHPQKTGQIIDVRGGWHDASDYLQYVTTTANAVYNLFYAYSEHPGVYSDNFNSSGDSGPNGIPDILDEALWGLDWLMKMNPSKGEMYNQVADDRDHRGFRFPNRDSASYGHGLYRPVYYITGKPQGPARFKNRTTGVSSAAGKFASAFAIAAGVLKNSNPELSRKLATKARDAFDFGLTDLGSTQTACNVSPYFYEEDNYADDLELAAWQLFSLSGDSAYLRSADYWGSLEPVTPWIEKDTARHYQYYPFMNMGHACLGMSGTGCSRRYIYFMRKGLNILAERGMNDPFLISVPFTWCSNNFVAAALQQHILYREASGDNSFAEQEAALRDWLFGCNPWGTSMIIGLPAGGIYPHYPHSSFTALMGIPVYGGLVDGPVWSRIFRNLKGVELLRPDPFSDFQNGKAVYHDDTGDYSTNEPTMDGTACLSYSLSALEEEGLRQNNKYPDLDNCNYVFDDNGAVIRINPGEKSVYLVFSADEFGEGSETILNVLRDKEIKGSFFLTGNYIGNGVNSKAIRRMISEGHFLGPHSDKHLLYASWEKRDSLLVTRKEFEDDLLSNYSRLIKIGAGIPKTKYLLAPYEWYNKAVSYWAGSEGIVLVNLTPGTGTNADYTTPEMKNYQSSDALMTRIKKFESSGHDSLNGALILVHLGTDPSRIDKFYKRLGDLIDYLKSEGYNFKRL
ncbi:MAG TPA: glycoside hydrolase family 9 protein [Bacteroidales bacterium]|nr:glycoside hydrolase family 9 protein [Bacteroidales bacterium]